MPQKVKIIWNTRNKKWYESKGYIFTKMGEEFEVNFEDLSKASTAKINLKCDYCGKDYYPIYNNYINQKKRNNIKDDCCEDCKYNKIQNTIESLYGTNTVMKVDSIKIKQNNTIKKKYGVDNISQAEEIKEKKKETCLKNHGVEYPMQSKVLMQKREENNMQKYGYKYPNSTKQFQERRAYTLYKNGNCPTSTQQTEIYNTLKENKYSVDLNHPVGNLHLDVAIFIDNIKIDLEYDCWHWHQDSQKDRRRDEFLKSQGWKILRIKSSHKLPTLEQLKESINKLISSDRTFTRIVLDDWEK